MNRVAITGIGAVTPVGHTAEQTWDSLVAGRSGIGRLDLFDVDTYPVRIGAVVRDFDFHKFVDARVPAKHLSRAARFGVAAAVEAARDAGPGWGGNDPYVRGVAIGASVGRPELAELVAIAQAAGTGTFHRQAPGDVLLRDQNVGVAAIAGVGDCRGPAISVSTACAGAAHALGEAYRRIQEGECTALLAGGFDSLTTWLDVLGFSLLGALTDEYNDDPQRASRPFDAQRSGFVLGEGAVVAVLEDWDVATARGAHIHAELVGYGSTLNAYRITDSPPDGGGAIPAMRAALDEAGLSAVDYVVAHGTGTPGNDLSETVAIKSVLGPAAYAASVSSPKSMTGHLTSAAGGVNLVAALGALRHQVVPPTLNLDHPDPKLDLDYVPHVAKPRRVRSVLVNAFAFGGTNASFVVRAADDLEQAA